jgi:GR25 family glycosyltransferase involved in LPS biosynthesis
MNNLPGLNTLYINLEHRKDRNTHVKKQLELIGIVNAIRFNAVQLLGKSSALGCSMSHLKCVQIAKESGWPYILICEDDIEFLDPSTFNKQIAGFLSIQPRWDVILLAGNNILPYSEKNDYSVKVSWCQTTTGYIVAAHYYDVLINNYKSGIQKLLMEPKRHALYAIDQYWTQLQKQDSWFLIIPLTVVQRDDYSDIERKIVSYKKIMTILDK